MDHHFGYWLGSLHLSKSHKMVFILMLLVPSILMTGFILFSPFCFWDQGLTVESVGNSGVYGTVNL